MRQSVCKKGKWITIGGGGGRQEAAGVQQETAPTARVVPTKNPHALCEPAAACCDAGLRAAGRLPITAPPTTGGTQSGAATTHCTSTSAAVLVREVAHALLPTRRSSTHLSLCLVCVCDARGAHGLARGPVAAVKLVAGRVAGGVAGSVLQLTRGSEAWTARPSPDPAACRRCMAPGWKLPGFPAAAFRAEAQQSWPAAAAALGTARAAP